MNNIKYDSTEGFPLDTTNLNFLQDALKIAQVYGSLAGDLSIISGCEANGNRVKDGYVFIDGELLEFRGGNKSTHVVIKESEEKSEFENGEKKVIEVTRWVTFGSSGEQWKWSDFQRPKNLPELEELIKTKSHTIPEGIITMWAGNTGNIPEGWALCDGSNGTPDLSGRFIVGIDGGQVDYNAIGKKGGENRHKLTVSEMPKHSHGVKDPGHRHSYSRPDSSQNSGRSGSKRVNWKDSVTTYQTGRAYTGISLYDSGGGLGHENRPPYFVLAYIQFKG